MSLMIFVACGGEPPHVEVVVQKQGGDVRAVEQVLHVVAGPRQLVHLGLQLGVDGLQFLVHRLHLLLGGGEFLVGGLQFLVGGLQFLVGGPEFLLRGLHLLVGGLRLAADLLEFLLQFRQPRRCGRELCGARPAALAATGAATSVKTIITKPCSGSGFVEPLDGHIHELLAAVGPDLESVQRHACLSAGALSGRRWSVRSAALRGPWRRCSSWPCRRPVPGICRSGR